MIDLFLNSRPLWGSITVGLFLSLLLGGCNYARMENDEAVNTYGAAMPEMDVRTIPAAGGPRSLYGMKPRDLTNPLPVTEASVTAGRIAYDHFCVHCHGPEGDGHGTVGQSFAPLPTDLGSAPVARQSDGELFVKISRGFKRHPPLAYIVSEGDRWAVIDYLRSPAMGRKGQ